MQNGLGLQSAISAYLRMHLHWLSISLGWLFTGNGSIIGAMGAFILVAFFLYMLFRRYQESNVLNAKVKV